MKPTNKTCSTEIGLKRKQDRMVAAELAKRYPDIYEEIVTEVNGYIEFDQWNPRAQVISVAVGKESAQHRTMKAVKRQMLKEAVDLKQEHPRYFGTKLVKPVDIIIRSNVPGTILIEGATK